MSERIVVVKPRGGSGAGRLVLGCFALIAAIFACGALTIGGATALNLDEWETQEANYEESLDGAETAQITIEMGVGVLHVDAIDDGDNLFEADVTYANDITYEVSGGSDREITLGQNDDDDWDVSFPGVLNIHNWTNNDWEWNVRLNSGVPMELDLSGGVGEVDLDLRDLYLTDLNLSSGVGQLTMSLPEARESYVVHISGGVGSVEIELPEDADVRLEANQGVGEVDVPNALEQISGDRNGPADSGVWETDNFDEAEATITIIYSGGVGSLDIR